MRDRLIGYVLGALEASEHEELERQIEQDVQLREELTLVRKALAPLESDREHHRPPPGLARTTCRKVLAACREVPAVVADAGRAAEAALAPTRGWGLVDVAVAAGIVLAAGVLFFPAINHSRFNARLTNCQNNLAEIGRGLAKFSQNDPEGAYPSIPEGKLSVAGMYAPQLVEAGYVSSPNVFRCSRTPAAGECRGGAAESFECGTGSIPSMDELRSAEGDQLHKLLARAGGSYGYSLGYKKDGKYHPTRPMQRTNFPIMADAPCPRLDYQQSSNHEGYGQNVLFDDGHTRYLTTCRQPEGCPDRNFFRNDSGQISAGTHVDDAVIGGSLAQPTP